MTTSPRRRPFEPIPYAAGYRRLTSQACNSTRKRDRTTTLSVSQEALNILLAEAAKVDGTFGGLCGLLVHYLARTGKFPALLKEAMEEGTQ